jgi:hypothetical protein
VARCNVAAAYAEEGVFHVGLSPHRVGGGSLQDGAPARPYPPAKGGQPYIVGGGAGDFTAQVQASTLSSAVGSFDSITNVTSERDQNPNTYSLQLNTNFFPTTICL